jgi:hypothetical protein
MTHRESRCRAKIAVFVVPALATIPVTMSRDPVFMSVNKQKMGHPSKMTHAKPQRFG